MALRQCFATALRSLSALDHATAAPALTAATRAARAAAAGLPARQQPGCSPSYSSAAAAAQDDEAERTKMVNKLLYRSKQRGFLELDLLVGLWAEQQLPRMTTRQLAEFSRVLDEENPDLFKWLTGQLPTPDHLAANEQYMALKAHVDSQLSDNLHHAAAAAAGKDWVRGWDDGNKAAAAAAGGGGGGGAQQAAAGAGGAQ